MSKQKTVFSNSELGHVFVSQSQESGRGSNMSFDGKRAFSYGHYTIAHVLDSETLLVNSDRYSNTTNKHILGIERAASHMQIFRVPCVHSPYDSENIETNREYLSNQVVESFSSLFTKTARLDWVKESLDSRIKKYNLFCSFFGISDRIFLDSFTESLISELVDISKVKDKEKREKQERVWKEQRETSAKEYQRSISAWKSFSGEVKGYSNEVFLRVSGDIVETSRGAKVPLQSALLLVLAVESVLAGNMSESQLVGRNIGHYKVTSLDKETLTIGCHEIPLSEMREVLGELVKQKINDEKQSANKVLAFPKAV